MGPFLFMLMLAMVIWSDCPALGQIVINEFLPDPSGADSGKEFVELMNTGPGTANLNGIELQFANGAEEAHWLVRWACDNDIFLDPGGRFLVADRNWQGTEVPGVEVYLGLQNGPDAIRLVQGATVWDMVGYGPMTDAAMVEETAVPVVSGMSLARRPDGFDSNNNSQDFVPTDPSPGNTNFLPYDFRVPAFSMEPPSIVRPDESVTFTITLENYGTEALATGPVVLQVGTSQITGLLDGNSPGQQRSLMFRGAPGSTGKLPVGLRIGIPAPPEYLEIPLGYLQVGSSRLVINEVLGSPDQGQGEWVEFLYTSEQEDNLDQYMIMDEGGHWLQLPHWECENGALVVIAQDSLALRSWMETVESEGGVFGCDNFRSGLGPLLPLSSWPSLNNSAPEGRDFADRLYLCDADGCVVDHVTLGWEIAGRGQDVPNGHSLERVGLHGGTPEGSLWAPALVQSGSSPGCPNSVELAEILGADLNLHPALLDPARGVVALNIGFEVLAPGVGWDLRIYNLWGELVRDLGGEMHGPGPRQLIWDGRNDEGDMLPSGAYVVLLGIRSNDRGVLLREKKLAAIRRSES